MSRPPWARAFVIRSTALSICGIARPTAGATLRSSRLMMCSISRVDFVSRPADAGLGNSVVRIFRGMKRVLLRTLLGQRLPPTLREIPIDGVSRDGRDNDEQ